MTLTARDILHRISVAGQCLLLAMCLAWAWFERPAPVITVAWQPGLSDEARHQAEASLHLENGQRSDDAWQYELWSPRATDVAAVVAHPFVRDTEHIDRRSATIRADAGRGQLRVWWAGPFKGRRGRIEFRTLFAVTGIITLVCAVLWSGEGQTLRRRPTRGMQR